MHKFCHVATFDYVTCQYIIPFKMNNCNDIIIIIIIGNAQIMPCDNV
jgi:hypothetical protein